ncbi:MAG: DNA-directed RNA polymerase subunit omega [bacterium]|nr:DNA-directed RNA polymerase subunit omega [bacterium]
MEERDMELLRAVEKAGSSSRLINILSRRIRQLHHGARPLLEKIDRMSPTDIALREFVEGKIGFRERVEE